MTETTEPPQPWAPVPAADFIPLLLQTGFSPEAYRDRYVDLSRANWNAAEALSNFLLYGPHERRVAPMTLNCQALTAHVPKCTSTTTIACVQPVNAMASVPSIAPPRSLAAMVWRIRATLFRKRMGRSTVWITA
jgi:hypothetical protein